MATLSVALATFNEETNIAACLNSVRNFADEIVIVDGESTDKTVEIAQKYGARVTVTTNPAIFHINKQKAIDMVTKDWILQLDADERVSKELTEEIRFVINKSDAKDGYWIPRKNWFLGRFLMKGGQYPDYTMRLYKKGKGKLPQKSVHEQAQVSGIVGYLQHPLIHLADPTFLRYLMRLNRYTSLLAEELKSKKIGYNPLVMLQYLVVLPVWWLFSTYVRHKGFMDGWQGLVFSFLSSLRFPVAYCKYLVRR